MFLAIESFVRFFNDMLFTSRIEKTEPSPLPASNDNEEMEAEERRWADYR